VEVYRRGSLRVGGVEYSLAAIGGNSCAQGWLVLGEAFNSVDESIESLFAVFNPN